MVTLGHSATKWPHQSVEDVCVPHMYPFLAHSSLSTRAISILPAVYIFRQMLADCQMQALHWGKGICEIRRQCQIIIGTHWSLFWLDFTAEVNLRHLSDIEHKCWPIRSEN